MCRNYFIYIQAGSSKSAGGNPIVGWIKAFRVQRKVVGNGGHSPDYAPPLPWYGWGLYKPDSNDGMNERYFFTKISELFIHSSDTTQEYWEQPGA